MDHIGEMHVRRSGNGHNFKNKKYFIPANTFFGLYVRDVCPVQIGIKYSINFCDE